MSNSLTKKLFLAVIFLIFFALLNFRIDEFIRGPDVIFSLSQDNILDLLLLTGLLALTSLSYVIFTSITNNWKITAAIGFISISLPIIFLSIRVNYLVGLGFFLFFLIISLYMDKRLKNYINFNATDLFSSPTKNLAKLLIIVIAISYYLSITARIHATGFQIPDALIETALKFAPQDTTTQQTQLPNLTKEQIDLLKNNPQLLKQYGLDPKILNSLDKKTDSPTQNLIKNTIKDQLQNVIAPYQAFIPAVMAILIFFTLISFLSIFGLLISPIIWLIFWAFQKTGFITFTTENREVKKMVV